MDTKNLINRLVARKLQACKAGPARALCYCGGGAAPCPRAVCVNGCSGGAGKAIRINRKS